MFIYFFIISVAAIHLYFFYLETFLYTTPYGCRVFGITESFANESKLLAANQGVYNLMLAVGLIGCLFISGEAKAALATYIFSFVVVVGLFGGHTVSSKIYFFQALPGFLGLLALCFFA